MNSIPTTITSTIVTISTQKTDIPAIMDIATCFPEKYSCEIITKLQKNTFIAKNNDTIVGYVTHCKMRPKVDFMHPYCKGDKLRFNCVFALAVLPKFRSIGIARKLMEKLISTIDKPLFLQVRPSNWIARRLYESLGFRYFKAIADYYHTKGHPPTFDCIPSALLHSTVESFIEQLDPDLRLYIIDKIDAKISYKGQILNESLSYWMILL
jgi:GNAT superfamily N-acetyltransferase